MSQNWDTHADRALINRLLWRVMPLAVACLVISTIDRANIGFAKLQMADDVSLSEAVFALGSSLFYVGYVLFEIPSAMASYRYGARPWLARIMISWAAVTLLLTFTTSSTMFYVLRFILGAAEAGLYPALVFFLTLWFPQRDRIRAMGLLTLGSAFGNGLSAIISGSLLDLDGALGFAGWQWIFIVTGVMPIITTLLVLVYLPSRPDDAHFLSEAEKARVKELVADNEQSAHGNALSVLLQGKVIGFGLLYGIFLGAVYGIAYWLPTVFSSFGLSGKQNGFAIALPWAFDAILLILIPGRLKGPRVVIGALLLCALLAVASFGAAALDGSLAVKIGAMLIGIPAISIGIACFWTVPVRYFSGGQRAAAIGAISTLGNLGGVIALNLMPWIAKLGGTTAAALWVPSLGMVIVAVWAALQIATGGKRPDAGPRHEPA